MVIRWDEEKDRVLKFRYGISFSEILKKEIIRIRCHPTRMHQQLMFLEHDEYVWVVPFVLNEDVMFLKTFYPSRKYTRLYREGRL